MLNIIRYTEDNIIRYTEMCFLKFRKSSYFSLLPRLLLAGPHKFEGMFEVEDLILRLRLELGLNWVRGFVGMLGSGEGAGECIRVLTKINLPGDMCA